MTSRGPPPPFEGCTLDGVRYEAAYAATDRHRSGAVVAIDEASGARLWEVTLWTEPRELDWGLLAPPRYLHRVTRDVVPGRLRAVDEFGVLHVVDLATHAAKCLGWPAARERGVLEPGARVAPPSPAPISFEGRRYEQIVNGERQSLRQRTGLLAVTDEASNQRIDVIALYDHPHRDGRDAAEDDVFFVSAELDADRREIVIENERHERFACRIDDGSVRPLN